MAETLLKVGGFTPLTTIDYPDELAAVVFCQGCPWRCRYCQNSGLLKHSSSTGFYWPDILNKLKLRVGLIDAVVFSGGEPTLQSGLQNAINDVKALGFKAGLHTAGCYPERLLKLLPQLDWVGLDIKALAEDYPRITGVPDSGNKAWESLDILLSSNTDFEVRVTVHDNLLSEENLGRLLKMLAKKSIPKLSLQQCRAENMLDNSCGHPSTGWQNSQSTLFAQEHFDHFELRTG